MAEFQKSSKVGMLEDFVEYFLFPSIPEDLSNGACSERYEDLKKYMKTILDQCKTIAADEIKKINYIFHNEDFRLEIRTGNAKERAFNIEDDGVEAPLPPHLYGLTRNDTNIHDEWFITYMLYEMTRRVHGLIARVIDSDGEFLMIEAADFLPSWAGDDMLGEKAFVVDGALHIVQDSANKKEKNIAIETTILKIRRNPTLFCASQDIQNCIESRFKDFDAINSKKLFHKQIINAPLGVARILKLRPHLIAPAVHAFCERDPIDMKACRTMRYFPPEQRVRTTVRFTRCLYAMIQHNKFVPDRRTGWNLSGPPESKEYKEDLIGAMVACGFEILASQARNQSVGNGEDLKSSRDWKSYIRSLKGKGYFRDNLEGSAEYELLLTDAESYYKENMISNASPAVLGTEILEILRNSDSTADLLRDEENNLEPSDADDWLNISAEELDAMLLERYGPKKLYKFNGDITAEEFTKNLVDFLDKQSAFDGIANNSDDDDESDDMEDIKQQTRKGEKNANKRKNEFKSKVKKNHSMRKACNRNSLIADPKPSHSRQNQAETSDDSTHVRNFLDFVIPEDNWDSNSEMSDYADEDDLERNFEAMTNAEMDTYLAQMDRELAKTTIGKSFSAGKAKVKDEKSAADDSDDFDDIESFTPIDINVNTLKNMMDSYKSQLGGAGPVSNLLNAMGVGMSAEAFLVDDKDEKKDLTESTV